MATKKRYLALYFALTIPLAWIFWIPMILINKGVWTPPISIPNLVLSTLGALSPLVAIKIIEQVSRKQVQLGAVFKNVRFREWRLPWMLSAVFFFFGLQLLMILIYFGVELVRGTETGPVQFFNPDVFASLGWWVLVIIPVHFFPSLITSPILEEPGWRGFAFENLQRYVPRDAASLIVGSYWWLWHQGMNLAFNMQPSLYGYLFMLLDSFAIDALYTLNRGNLLAAILAHGAMATIFNLFFSPPAMWYFLVIKLLAVAFLRYRVHLQSSISV